MEVGSMNNDMQIEVLSRLPAKTLLGLKCVSKGWQRLISDRAFIRVHSERSKALSGFFFQERFQWCNEDIDSISYLPVGIGPASVHHAVLDFLPEKVVLMSSSNGLICCRSCIPSANPVIYICNPSNKNWVTLKWATPGKGISLALAFDPCCDPVDTSTNFKVVAVYKTETDGCSYFSFELYSSEMKLWRKSEEICYCEHRLFKNKGVFINGIQHWLTDGDQILTFNVENELSWLVALPAPTMLFEDLPEMCIGESEGHLYYIQISVSGLQVWILEEYYEPKWTLKFCMPLAVMEEENPHFLYNLVEKIGRRVTIDMIPWMDPLAFKDGFLFMRVSSKIYSYHLETWKMEELCALEKLGRNSLISPTVLPYCTSLVPL